MNVAVTPGPSETSSLGSDVAGIETPGLVGPAVVELLLEEEATTLDLSFFSSPRLTRLRLLPLASSSARSSSRSILLASSSFSGPTSSLFLARPRS